MKNAFSLKKPAFSGIGFITAIFIFGIALFITMEYYHIFTVKEIIDETDIQKSPAKYSITGRIRMQPVTVRSILPKSFDIPFKLSSNNIRTDD